MPSRRIRVVLADDHHLVRQGFRELLSAEPNIEVAGEASDGRELLDLVRRQACDVVLLDISMPGPSGIEVLRVIKREHPHLRVLVLTMHDEHLFGPRALAAGADGYLTKDSSRKELIGAIRTLVAGGKYVTARLAGQAVEPVGDPSKAPSYTTLSTREFEVLRLLGSAKTVTETAADLRISVKTVSTYRARILQKLQLRNTAELIQYAIRKRLVG
ncbi:response regulator [Nitrospira sp. Kam-Ns4a]